MCAASEGFVVTNSTIVGDVVAGGTIVSTLLGYVPAAAAALGVLWYAIQIWESRTVQEWKERRVAAHKVAKLARLQAQHKIIVAELEALEVVRAAKSVATEKVEVAKAEAAVQAAVITNTAAVKDHD